MGLLDSMIGGLAGGVGSIFSSAMNAEAQRETNRTMVDLANTAVQRRAKDMEAAGINPIMAAGQPAAVPGLQSPKIEDPVSSAIEGSQKAQAVSQSSAQTELTLAAARSANADARVKEATIQNRIDVSEADTRFAVQSLQDRLNVLRHQGEITNWNQVAAQAEAKIKGAMVGEDFSSTGYGTRGSPAWIIAQAQAAAEKAGASLTVQKIYALQQAVQAAGMNAEALKKIGIPPIFLDLLLDTAGVGLKAGVSLLK